MPEVDAAVIESQTNTGNTRAWRCRLVKLVPLTNGGLEVEKMHTLPKEIWCPTCKAEIPQNT